MDRIVRDLFERWAAALVDRCHIERELGGGGMSRVFLAAEPRHYTLPDMGIATLRASHPN